MKRAAGSTGLLAVTLGLLSLLSSAFAQPYYHGGPVTARDHGYEHGYRDGYESGRVSNLSNRDQDIRNQRLQAQGNGYQPAFGSEAEYSQGYREGFDDGSRDVSNGVRSRLEELFRSKDPGFNPDRSRLDPSDTIYRDSDSALFADPPDILLLIKWRELYGWLEETVDACKDVGMIISEIVIKGS